MKLQRRPSDGDALGYAAATALEIPFIPGDDAFRSEEGVEFVR